MDNVSKLYAACIAGTISANADIGHRNVTLRTAYPAKHIALNPRPLPQAVALPAPPAPVAAT